MGVSVTPPPLKCKIPRPIKFDERLLRRSSAGVPRTLVLNAISDRTQETLREIEEERKRKQPTPAQTELGKFLNGSQLKAIATLPSQSDGRITHIDVYRTSSRVQRAVRQPTIERSKLATRGEIDSFSDKSRARLRHVASNCEPLLISQFCLTYDNTNIPEDGRVTKKHLNRFLKALRRKVGKLSYLWVLEFQWGNRKGVPHYHLYLPFPPCRHLQKFMAETWNRITKGSEKQFEVHNHPKNFINWDMRKGGYVCKYLEKKEQKNVPAHFESVGRFWGTSVGIVPPPERWTEEHFEIEIVHTDEITGEEHVSNYGKVLYRALRRHHEACMRYVYQKKGIKKKAKSRLRKQSIGTTNLPGGGVIARQVQAWFYREDMKQKGLELF